MTFHASRRVTACSRSAAVLIAICSGAVLATASGIPEARAIPASSAQSTVIAPASSDTEASVRYRAPLAGELNVLTSFQPPPRRYGPGHFGVDLAASPGQPVLAAATGTVRFAGQVASRGVVVLVHDDGLSTEYEPVTPTVAVGDRLPAGHPIATVSTEWHASCAPARCLHWGARNVTDYVDPMSLLRPLGIVRLMPLDGDNRAASIRDQPSRFPRSSAGMSLLKAAPQTIDRDMCVDLRSRQAGMAQ
jgi:murein DD-endopeptidase MepM/ murein hydrolase activator NlpD